MSKEEVKGIVIEESFQKLIDDTKAALNNGESDDVVIYVVARLYATTILNNYISNIK